MPILDRLPLGHRNDPSVQADLNWERHGVDLPAGLEIQWLGTAGFCLTYEGTTLLIDPFLSRVPLRSLLRQRPMQAHVATIGRLISAADAIFVGHTHFDHAVDVPHIAVSYDAPVYGSPSTAHLLGLYGRSDLARPVTPHETYEIGPFTVRFRPSRHSKLIAGLAVPLGGELTCDTLDHLGAGQYRCGQVWGISIEVAGITLYHQGSADLIDDEIHDRAVDVFLCGIAGRMWTRHFVERSVRALDPALILAHHHDDFFRPVEGEMGFSLNVNLGGFAEDVVRWAPRVPVRTLDPLQSVTG